MFSNNKNQGSGELGSQSTEETSSTQSEYTSGEYTSGFAADPLMELESTINIGKNDGTLSEQIDFQYALYLSIKVRLDDPDLTSFNKDTLQRKQIEIRNFLKIFVRSESEEKIENFMRVKQAAGLLDPEFIPGFEANAIQKNIAFPHFYFIQSSSVSSMLESGKYAKSYIFTENPSTLLYIDTVQRDNKTHISPIVLNTGDKVNFESLIAKIPKELQDSGKPIEEAISIELKRALMNVVVTNNQPGYSRLRVENNKPEQNHLKQNEVVVVKGDETLTAYWLAKDKIVEKSFPLDGINNIVAKLPAAGKSTTEPYIVKEITAKFGCVNPGHTLKGKTHFRSLVRDTLALRQDKLVAVNPESKQKDIQMSTRMFTAQERINKRIIISPDGLFNYAADVNALVNTKGMVSHSGSNYAAYVINTKGEISLFEHIGMKDRVAHSSFFSGRSVLGAGEMKIANGKLVELTDYSGHYRPSLKNVAETLKYLQQHGVDISATKVLSRGQRYDAMDLLENINKYLPQ
jgi:hypothetical protein